MKTPISALITGSALMVSLMGVSQAAVNVDSKEMRDFKKAIRIQYDLKVAAFARKDADAIVKQFYTADAFTTGEGMEVAIGREQLTPMYQHLVNDYTVDIKSFHTYVKGDNGWDFADFYVTPRDKNEKPFSFKIVFMWEKVKGKWMCNADMFFKGAFDKARTQAATAVK